MMQASLLGTSERKPHIREWKFYTVGLRFGGDCTLPSQSLDARWTKQRDGFPFVAPVDPEIVFVDSNDTMPRVKFAHPD